jgi:hypothetical protein
MSDREHVLSDLCDEMPGRPNLLSTAVYAVSASGYTMSIVCDAVSVCVYALSNCEYVVSVCEYVVSDEADILCAGFRNVVSSPSYEVSSGYDGVWGSYEVSDCAYAVSGDDNDVYSFYEMSYDTHAVPDCKYLLSVFKHAVQAGRYAMSEPGHILSAICDEMSKRLDLFSGRLHDMSCHKHVVSAGSYAMCSIPGYAVPTAADAVSAGIYARSSSEHVLSAFFDEMPWRPDLLSGYDYSVPACRYTMSVLSDEVSD